MWPEGQQAIKMWGVIDEVAGVQVPIADAHFLMDMLRKSRQLSTLLQIETCYCNGPANNVYPVGNAANKYIKIRQCSKLVTPLGGLTWDCKTLMCLFLWYSFEVDLSLLKSTLKRKPFPFLQQSAGECHVPRSVNFHATTTIKVMPLNYLM